MIPYKNLSGNSGISHYQTGTDFIRVKFKGNHTVYTYSNLVTGKRYVDEMKRRAEKGIGLGTYISQNEQVKKNFST